MHTLLLFSKYAALTMTAAASLWLAQIQRGEEGPAESPIKLRVPIEPTGPDRPQTADDVLTAKLSAAKDSEQTDGATVTSLDIERFLANRLLAASESEISTSDMAANRAERQQVKEFAQHLADEHRALSRQLQSLATPDANLPGTEAPMKTAPTPESPVRTDKLFDLTPHESAAAHVSQLANKQPGTVDTSPVLPAAASPEAAFPSPADAPSAEPARRDPVRPLNAEERQTYPLNQLTDIDRRIHERIAKELRSELGQHTGAAFDDAFLHGQIVALIEISASADTIREQSPGRLSQIAEQVHTMAERQLKQAKQLSNEHKESAGKSVADSSEHR